MIPSLRKIVSVLPDLNTVQDAVDAVLRIIRSKEIIDGRLIADVNLVAGSTNTINHGLGKDLRGWFLVSKNSNSNVWEVPTNLANSKLSLQCSANSTVSIWVF